MSRDNIIGLIVILFLMIGYSIWIAPSEEEVAERRSIQDSIADVQKKADAIKDEIEQEKIETDAAAIEDIDEDLDTIAEEADSSEHKEILRSKYGLFAGSAKGKDKFFTLENEVLELTISKQGGYVHSAKLKGYKTSDSKPLKLFYDKDDYLTINFFHRNLPISTKDLYFEPQFHDKRFADKNHIKIEQGDSTKFAMRLHTDNSTKDNPKYIEFLYELNGAEYMLNFNISFKGLQDVIAANTTAIGLDWSINMPRQEKNRDYEQNNSSLYYRYASDGDVDRLRQSRDDSENFRTNISWVSFKQQFFSSTLIAENNFSGGEVEHTIYEEEKNEEFLKELLASMEMPYSSRDDNHYPMRFYFGPNHYQTLTKYNIDLERQIPLGWGIFGWINRFAVIPVFNFLDGFNFNYGIIILILTLLLKTVLLPIAYKTYISSARMRVLKPEVEELSKKYPKKEDAMKKQQATMALYKKGGVNPMAGCVPMLLQLPILIAMFRFFPASIELRQESFLWADDLSSYDSILDLPFSIPFYGDHVSLFTLLMAVSTIIYTRMNNEMMGSTNQMPGMKTMLYIMPVMLLGIFNSFAAALSYYYFLTNIITFGQMFLFRKLINEDKIHKKIQENKKKPVKKSNWQKKLEEMQKEKSKQQKRKR